MKKLLTVLLAVIIAECFGQGRPLLGGLRRPGQQSWDEKQFLEKHPTGTNEFNRTFPQQQDYEKGFDLKSFLGYEFGGTYTNGVAYSCGANAYKECLVNPFRMFQEVILRHTDLGHLYEVELRTNTINIASTSLSNEIERIKAILSKTYQIDLKDNKRRHRPSADCSFDFTDSPDFHFDMYCSCDRTTGNGQMRLTATSRRIYNLDESKVREKKEREVAARSTTIEIGEDVGADLLTASVVMRPKMAEGLEKVDGAMATNSTPSVTRGAERPMLRGLLSRRERDEIMKKRYEEYRRQQDEKYKNVKISSFCGFAFGAYTNRVYRQKLAKPFRYFTNASVRTTEKGRIKAVEIHASFDDMPDDEIKQEVVDSVGVIAKKYGFENFTMEKEPTFGMWRRNFGRYDVNVTKYANKKATIEIIDGHIEELEEEELKKKSASMNKLSADAGMDAL